jgi:predicted amidohydrolase YtcJ
MPALAIVNARIFTADPHHLFAQALLCENGRITVVGTTDAIRRAMPPQTRMLDLSGRLVTPGIVDAHCHLLGLGQTLKWVKLAGHKSLADCQKTIAQAARNLKPGQWLIGRGWNHMFWDVPREPQRADLDAVVANHPVMMIRTCGHAIWINSKAMEVAGITAETPDPPGGRIDRDPETGQPTGLLRECREIIRAHIPAPGMAQLKQAVLDAQQLALSMGLTGVHSCESLLEYEALEAVEKDGALLLRVNHLLPPADLDEAQRRGIGFDSGSSRLWHTHAKLFADGSLGAGTAYMHQPYETSDSCGISCLSTQQMTEQIAAAYRMGRSAAIHAIGDRAVTEALNAIAAARQIVPGPRRDRIEHIQRICEPDIDRMVALGVTASVQPGFLPTDWKMAEKMWGIQRCNHGAYAWKTLQERGIRLQFGSDAPVESNDPRIGIQAAVARTGRGMPAGGWHPEQALSLTDALLAYTRAAAATSFRETRSGTIAPGFLADFTIFDRDMFAPDAPPATEVSVEYTVIDGVIVYEKG